MFKEGLQRRFDEVILRSRKLGKEACLNQEGKPSFEDFIRDYKNGQIIEFWRYIHMLDGFDYTSHIYGLENLEPDKPTLIVANHPYGGPLRGHGQRFVTNHHVHEATGKETRWLFGLDKTSPERFTRKRFVNQSSLIPVRDDNKEDKKTSGNLITQAFKNKDTMGINPEGNGSKTLIKAVPEAARMIILAAIYNYNIVCVATGFKDGIFFMNVDPPLDNQKIQKARQILKPDNYMSKADKEKKREELQQLISDYAMAKIAQHLPEGKRGYYSQPQQFIDAFEDLTG